MKCKICSENIYITQIKSKSYHFCPNCLFISLDKNHFLSEKQEKERYLNHQNSLENKGYVDFLDNFIKKAVLPYKNQIKTILDFGSGSNPVLAELLRKNGFEVDNYDYYFDKNNDYKTKKYDLITMVKVIEHLKNPLKTLKELKKVLNKKGKIAVMTLFNKNKEKIDDWWYITDPTHISFFSEKTMVDIAEQLTMRLILIDEKNICTLTKYS